MIARVEEICWLRLKQKELLCSGARESFDGQKTPMSLLMNDFADV
jgi:hypothetical protein